VQILLACQIVYSLLNIGVLIITPIFAVLFKSRFSAATIAQINSAVSVADLLELGIYATTGVIFIMWLKKLHRNLESMGVTGMVCESWHCSWAFFIPLVNLWKPLSVVKEIWKASAPELSNSSDWKNLKPAALVSWWWLSYLCFLLSTRIVDFMSKGYDRAVKPTQDDYFYLMLMIVASNLVRLVAAILAIFVVRKLTDRQLLKYAAMPVQTAETGHETQQ